MLEEEEALSKEYQRAREVTRKTLGDVRDEAAAFLDDIYNQMSDIEKVKIRSCREARRLNSMTTNNESGEFVELRGPCCGAGRGPRSGPYRALDHVKASLDRWTEATKKEVEALFGSGALIQVSVEVARDMERRGDLRLVPSKCVFTLRPPKTKGHGSLWKLCQQGRLAIAGAAKWCGATSEPFCWRRGQ